NAISADGGILVSAAAGSGKTSVLTERVIRKLTDEKSKVSADKLLIVTFTNAAALEMRTRIENALLAKIAETPNNDNLIEQYNLLASSDISTIDSFCINIVRENFEDCGVDQNFTVTDGSDLTDLKEGILSELIDQKFDSKDPVFRELLSILNCEDNDNNLREIVKEIYKKSTTIPFPEKYLSELVEPYSNGFDSNHIWFKDAFDFARSGLEEAREYLDQIYELGATVKANPDKLQEEIDHFKWFYDQLEQCLKNSDWDGVSSLAISYEHPTARILDNSETGVKYKYCREQLSEYFKELKYYFPYPIKEIDETVKAVNPPLSMLFDMVREYSEKIFETFVENNTLTFYHTEQLALKLLCKVADNGDVSRTQIAEDYISRYDEVMVDEYQDVNDLQELMFSILSDDCKKLFAVGDIKQSIYRFRGSNPKNFLKKKNDYNPFDLYNSQNKQKIILSENFRSRKCICDFVNFVFEKLLTTETGGIVYNEEEVLNFAAKYYIEKNDESTDLIVVNTDSDSEDKYEVEANAIAGYIKELVLSEKMIKDGDGEKPVTFGDICILLESKSKAPTIVKSLKNHGIPVSYNSDDYCKTAEISLVLSLLSVIDNPLNNVDLLTVLLSPIFSFTPDDIVLMRKYERYGDLYRAVLLASKNGDKKCVNFIERINELKKKRMIMPFSRFLTYLVYDTEIFAVISSLDNSHYRRKNIYTLISYANSFSGNGIGEFVSHIRSLDNDAFAIVDNDINSVKIMTMHKSKGLQFPVCILANLSKRFNKDDMQGSYILSEKYGFTFKPFDDDQYEYIESVGNELAKRFENDGFIAERIRLLYVAMTRAEEKLVLVTALPGKDTFSKMAASLTSGKIPTKSILRSGSLAQFVLMACLMHPDAGALRSLSGIDVPVVPTESR
ncbi:MAG: UvrD-helicase domain-containing protein, partial [Clostridia bacterium]|nr:UvrD-helicase domain-containing protein [Clostridia bacterium]